MQTALLDAWTHQDHDRIQHALKDLKYYGKDEALRSLRASIVINAGAAKGVKTGDRLEVWRPGKPIRDPETGKVLRWPYLATARTTREQ